MFVLSVVWESFIASVLAIGPGGRKSCTVITLDIGTGPWSRHRLGRWYMARALGFSYRDLSSAFGKGQLAKVAMLVEVERPTIVQLISSALLSTDMSHGLRANSELAMCVQRGTTGSDEGEHRW